ncbi:MAG: hypothetical protein MAG795_00755 [Candidatus Woesearchaeota archaeon]|nr:hypothetical protein [Candidatus Woesearchaeota archaeon]
MKKLILLGLILLVTCMVIAQQDAAQEPQEPQGPQEVPEIQHTQTQELDVEVVEEEKNTGITLMNQVKSTIIGFFSYIATRDYISTAKNFGRFLLGLNLWVKIAISIVILIIALIIWNLYFKDCRRNNMRKARKLHKKAKKSHDKGDEGRADILYQRAAEYREKAQEQW